MSKEGRKNLGRERVEKGGAFCSFAPPPPPTAWTSTLEGDSPNCTFVLTKKPVLFVCCVVESGSSNSPARIRDEEGERGKGIPLRLPFWTAQTEPRRRRGRGRGCTKRRRRRRRRGAFAFFAAPPNNFSSVRPSVSHFLDGEKVKKEKFSSFEKVPPIGSALTLAAAEEEEKESTHPYIAHIEISRERAQRKISDSLQERKELKRHRLRHVGRRRPFLHFPGKITKNIPPPMHFSAPRKYFPSFYFSRPKVCPFFLPSEEGKEGKRDSAEFFSFSSLSLAHKFWGYREKGGGEKRRLYSCTQGEKFTQSED